MKVQGIDKEGEFSDWKKDDIPVSTSSIPQYITVLHDEPDNVIGVSW